MGWLVPLAIPLEGTIQTMNDVVRNWTAPRAVSTLRQNGGDSSWHVQLVSATGRYLAGHFALTGEGDQLHGWSATGRTAGRALRRLRRHLRRHPVAFSPLVAELETAQAALERHVRSWDGRPSQREWHDMEFARLEGRVIELMDQQGLQR